MTKRSQLRRIADTTQDMQSPERDKEPPEPTGSTSVIVFEQLESHKLTQVGDYQLCREIGRGGMGIVYEATELSLDRKVALKVLPAAAHLDSMLSKRFNNESRAAAQLNHPNIVPVYAVGAADGIDFFAMQLIEGRNLHQVIKEIRSGLVEVSTKGHAGDATVNDHPTSGRAHRREEKRKSSHAPRSDSRHDERVELSVTDYIVRSGRHSSTLRAAHAVARLGAKVADALQHAHEMGIIHRDIKPSNLMLDLHGKVWVTDFGLAQVKNSPSLTRTGVLLGTLRYMSPEQATGVRALVDHRTDIYSLAVTLCELLTLRRLINGKTTEEILRQVIYGAPVRIQRIDPAVPEDMAVILEKAMAKNPMERYLTAGEMAEDLNRFLRNEAIKARRPNVLKRSQRWLERHRAVAAVMSVAFASVFLMSLVATGAVWHALQGEIIQRGKALRALTVSEALRLEANASLELPTDPGLSLALALKGEGRSPGLEANRVVQAAIDAGHEYAAITPRQQVSTHVAISPDALTAITCVSGEVPDDEAHPALLHHMKDASVLRKLDNGDCITSAAFSPSGRFVITASKAFAEPDGNASRSRPPVLWEASTGNKLRVFTGASLSQTYPGMFHPSADSLLLCLGEEAQVYDLRGGPPKVRLRGHSGLVTYAEFSPNGKRILTISEDHTIRVWDSQAGRELRPPIDWDPNNARELVVNFVASSDALIVCESDSIKLYAADTLSDASPDPLAARTYVRVAVSRTLDQVASFGNNEAVILSAKNLEPICELHVPSRITQLRFHPTDAVVLVVCGKQMFLFDSETGELLSELRGHAFSVTDASFAPGSPRMASVANDRTLRLWHTESGLARRTFRSPRDVYQAPPPHQVALSRGDAQLAVGSRLDYFTSLRDPDGLREPGELSGMTSEVAGDSERLVLIRGKTVSITESSTAREIYRGAFSDYVTPETQLIDQGRHLLVHTLDLRAFLVDLNSGARRRLGDNEERIVTVVVSPDSSIAVLVADSGRYFAVDSASGNFLWSRRHDLPIADIDISPDQQTLALVDIAGNVEVWMPDGQAPIATLRADGHPVNRIKFALDGKRLISWHSLSNRAVRCYETRDLDSHTEYAAEGQVRLDAHRELPLLVIGTDQQAVAWNYLEQSVQPLESRGCRAICLSGDRVAMLLSRTPSLPPALHIRSLSDEQLVHEEDLELTPSSLTADSRTNQFLVTQFGYAANVFQFTTGEIAFFSKPHPSPIVFASFSAATKGLVTVSENGLVLISDGLGNVLHRGGISGQKVTATDLDGRGEVLMIGSETGDLTLWSVLHGSHIALDGHTAPIRSIRIDHSGNRAVTVAAGEPARYWDLRTHASIEIKVADPLHAEVSGNNLLVIAGDARSNARKAWLILDGQKEAIDITQSQGTSTGQFSPDGQRVGLLAADGKLDVIRLKDRTVECSIFDPVEQVVRFAFAPDSKSLLTGQASLCSLWRLGSCSKTAQDGWSKSRFTLNDQWTPFSHDGKWFLTTGPDVRKCAADPAAEARKSVFRVFTQEERQRFHLDLGDQLKHSY